MARRKTLRLQVRPPIHPLASYGGPGRKCRTHPFPRGGWGQLAPPTLFSIMNQTLDHKIRSLITPSFDGWCSLEKALHIAEWCSQRDSNIYLELGIFAGKSLIPAGLGFADKGSGVAWGVDPWSVDAALEGHNSEENNDWWKNKVPLEDIHRQFVKRVLDENLTQYIHWIRDKSQNCYDFFRQKQIDVLHIDSNHATEVCLVEAQNYVPIVRQGGIIILDDADWSTVKPAVEYVQSICGKAYVDHGDWRAYRKA